MPGPSPDQFDTILSLQESDVLSGRYRLVRELGRGGMGVVWLAQDQQLEHEVALKLLPTVLSRDRRSVARLKEEAKRSLRLTHPHIVRLLNFEQDAARGELAFLVMQYVAGHTLNDLLADCPNGLPLDRVSKWAKQLAEAIDFAHAQGVLHRDIKPSNVIIDGDDNAYLMDFWIARELKDTMTRVTGRDSSGTLPYMSPQHLLGENHKSNDIYSLAATLYEALKGNPPFVTGDLAQQIQHVGPMPMEGQPEYVNAALLAGLAKEKDDRPGSARELVGLLGGDSTRRRVPARTPDRATHSGVPTAVKVLVGLVVMVLAVVGIRSLLTPTRQRPLQETARTRPEAPRSVEPQDPAPKIMQRVEAPPKLPQASLPVTATEASPVPRETAELLEAEPVKILDLGNGVAMELVLIPAGEFMMGSENGDSDEKPAHRVRITKPFYLGKYEVTQAQWQAVMGSNPSHFKGSGNLPVETVSWDDCQDFCRKLNDLLARRGEQVLVRLPTEAEWEYACRAGTTTPFHFGATISTDQANYDGNYTYGNGRKGEYRKKTVPVSSFSPNAWGLYNMHGNVWEWCQDRYGAYPSGAQEDPTGPASGEYRVLRGGSWFSVPWFLRSAYRNRLRPDFRNINFGFRVAAGT